MPVIVVFRSDENTNAFLVDEMIIRHEYVSRSQHVKLHFDADRRADVDALAYLAGCGTYADRAYPHDLVAGRRDWIFPLPSGVGSGTRSEIKTDGFGGGSIKGDRPVLDENRARATP